VRVSTQIQAAVGRFVWHDHVSGDASAAREFYGKLLGWTTEIWKPGEIDYPMITANGQMHGGFGPAQGGAPSHWLGHVVVDDVDAAASRAEAAGGALLSEPMDIPEVGRMAAIRDPQGAVFSAFAPAGEGPIPEGVFVWDELQTTDVEGAKSFYTEVLGWTTADMDMGEQGTYTMFRSGDADRAGAMQLPPGLQAPPHWLVYIGTDDVDATVAKAKELGATPYMEGVDIPNVGRLAVLADPTGATFGLFQPRGQPAS
jgi:predicted enzyme related to lactoylglutathione lyase